MKAMHLFAAAAILLASAAGAQTTQGGDHASHHAAPSTADSARAEGEVRRIDLEQGKVTLRHGPLANLDMPAMTMVFTATQRGMLEGLRPGDKVRFTADKKDGMYIVTAIEVIR